VRVALVGAGAHARDHAHAIAALSRSGRDVRVAVVVDVDRDCGSALAGALGVPWSPDLLSFERETVDVADVCTPTHSHRSISEMCASLRLPTLVDKPLATTLDDVDAMIAAFDSSGVTLTPGHSTRFVPGLRALATAVRSGRLGEPTLVAVSHSQGYAWSRGWRAWQHDTRASGGRIVHFGIHDIDLACWIAGSRVKTVRAIATPSLVGGKGAWSSASIQLGFESECVGLVTQDWEVQPSDLWRKSCRVVGALGDAVHDSMFDEVARASQGGEPVDYQISLRDEIANWLDSVEGRAQPVITARQARQSLSVALAARRSAEEDGLVVEMIDLDPDV
jgi:predicted dehydrogenase